MRYWDASAIIPLLVAERRTSEHLALREEDPDLIVWWGTRVECVSALARLDREGYLDALRLRNALRALDELAAEWDEIQPVESIRVSAEALLLRHPLRAADALQLAAALVATGAELTAVPFVCADDRLRLAAIREGLDVLPESVVRE